MKFMAIFGTRPEAIKIIPVIKKLKESGYQVTICVTAQQREMLDQSLDFFEVIPDYDLNIMKSGQTLPQITSKILDELTPVFKDFQPEVWAMSYSA